MGQPFVNQFGSGDETLRDTIGKAFDAAFEALPDRAPLVKKLVDEIWEDVVTQLHNSIDDYLGENLKDRLCWHAAEIAESMLRNALAGDDRELRNLFGFNDWYMKHAYIGRMPTQWALLDVLMARRPDLMVDERIKQRDTEITLLRQQIGSLRRQLDRALNPNEDRESI